jgi:hypothetical protein
MKHLLLVILALVLSACEAPDFAFNDAIPNCARPAERAIEQDSPKGCWRITQPDPDHGLSHEEPAHICDNPRNYCLVVVPYEKFWVTGMGHAKNKVEAVDCSEVCQ